MARFFAGLLAGSGARLRAGPARALALAPALGPLLVLLMAMALSAAALPARAATELLMVEQAGCIYCERWHAEVGGEYPLTDEGREAPLRTVRLRDMPIEGVQIARPVTYTPTFILLRDGVEADRLEGYPGEDFFWGLLGGMLAQAR